MIQAYEMLQLKLANLLRKRETSVERLAENEKKHKQAQAVFAKESLDVKHLEKQSLSTFIQSLMGTYEKKVTKEKQEQIAAKVALDAASALYLEAREELANLDEEIVSLRTEITSLREELVRIDAGFQEKITQAEKKQYELKQEASELNEAIQAGERVLEAVDVVWEELDSAHSMATVDMWTDSFFIDLMKYNKIDQAEEELTYLGRTLDCYKSELKDVNLQATLDYEELDQMRRAFDIFFDNIFSDWNTRDTIRRNLAMLEELGQEVEDIQDALVKRVEELKEEIRSAEEFF